MSFKWISKKGVIAIHNEQIFQHGGLPGLRDEGLLDSALNRPENMWSYEKASLPKCAAAYAFGIIRNHPSYDGNKRTAFITAVTFLLLNGHYITASETEVVLVITALANGSMEENTLVEWFEKTMCRI